MTYSIDTNKVVSEIFNDEAVIVNLASGAYYSFKGSAITIWQLLGAGYSDEEIIGQFKDAESINKFIAFLAQENLISTADTVVKETLTFDQQFTLPEYKKYDDMKDLLLLDPIHEVDQTGWPHKKAE
jgi:hypothetical protein